MIKLRNATAGEYALWYLKREFEKDRRERVLPSTPDDAIAAMGWCEVGKWYPWFPRATWSIVTLDLADFSTLVFPEIDWSKAEGLVPNSGSDYRILKRVAERARLVDYLKRPTARKHLGYYERLQGGLHLTGDNRIAICTATDGEHHANPSAQQYLLDGSGRSLPYMMLVLGGELPYTPVEAFLAQKVAS